MLATVLLGADVHIGLHIAQFGIGFCFITDTTPHWLVVGFKVMWGGSGTDRAAASYRSLELRVSALQQQVNTNVRPLYAQVRTSRTMLNTRLRGGRGSSRKGQV